MFSKKATQTDEILLHHQFDINLVKSTVKILSIFVAFLENMNFKMKIAWKLHVTAMKNPMAIRVFTFEEMQYVLLNQTWLKFKLFLHCYGVPH